MNSTDDPYAGVQKILDEASEQFQETRLNVQRQLRAAIGEYDKQYALMRESLRQAAGAVFHEARVIDQVGEAFSGLTTSSPVAKRKRTQTSRKRRSRAGGARKCNAERRRNNREEI